MLVMFGHTSGVDDVIINVDEQKLMEELPEHLMHEILEYGGSADQSIRHDEIYIVARRGHKSCLPLVPLTYPDEFIGTAEV